MRVLHTSDWHLGVTLSSASRDEEHRRFLTWLAELVEIEGVEVVIVAGDVFHHMHPSAEAQEIFYRGLARLSRCPGLRTVIVVGGNHDSAARLDAPRSVLGALKIHVVGGFTGDVARCVQVVGDARGPALAIGALPYVNEYRLGVRTTGRSADAIRFDMKDEFAQLYTRLASACEAAAPGAPMICTGHLTTAGSSDDDFFTPLHQSQAVGGLPAETFDQRFAYVALGHIHRLQDVAAGRIWYSGTPVPVARHEADTPRHVIVFDVHGDGVRDLRPVAVPTFRRLVTLEGRVDALEAALRALSWTEELEPYVTARVQVSEAGTGAIRALAAALEAHPEERRPRLIHAPEALITPATAAAPAPRVGRHKPLAELRPEDVFRRLHRARRGGADPDGALVGAFRELLEGGAP